MSHKAQLTCYLCGMEHAPAQLKPGEKALCARCDTLMAKGPRLGPQVDLVFSLTGLILAAPAAFLPFVSASKLGDERTSTLLTGVVSLWEQGMRTLAILVFACGGLFPLLLLAALAALHLPTGVAWPESGRQFLFRAARFIGEWAIPEVQVLAVFVALGKLGSVVELRIGPGFWCYCGMTLSLLIAQRSFEFDATGPLAATSEATEASAP